MNDRIKQRARELYANEWSKIDSHYAAGIRSGDILATPEIRAITAALNESAPKPEAQAAGDDLTVTDVGGGYLFKAPNGKEVYVSQATIDALSAPASHDAQQPPAFQRWSMTKGSDGARWSVYMDHDPCGEWVKWIEVQQHCFGIVLAQQPAVMGDGVLDALLVDCAALLEAARSSAYATGYKSVDHYDGVLQRIRAVLPPAATPGDGGEK